ncbi:M3 family metallopeptidase [Alkalihalobacterium alkalinitrilicum]|uniref:M3 family metallopeptidase n=1 Tax=Alkalihalobacterium alkalinitrilicum TaxID=427920 RepID=UPI00099536DE|nr:M3 family metallopeptidase [Alkalihalobacterium alkalinitrilicum]
MCAVNIETFLNQQNETIKPLYQSVLFNHWMAATTGQREWNEKHETALNDYFSHFANPELIQKVLTLRKENNHPNIQHRQLEDLYRKMVKNQLSKETLAQTLKKEKELSQTFNSFRPVIQGKETTNNEIHDILKTCQDSQTRKEAWLASKRIGKKLEKQILELIHKRNDDARALGYDNFYQMSFETQELEIDHVFSIFENLKKESDEPFQRIKAEIDEEMVGKWGIPKHELRPWHYTDPFFQEAPPVAGIDLDQCFERRDLVVVANETFRAMGLEVEDVLKKSDLYPRENKNPFGFCTDINREGDVRILVNLDPSLFWCTALLHELGHATYFKYIDRNLPFMLRFHSHTLTTEAIALLFGRMTKMYSWKERFLGIERNQLDEMRPSIKKMLQRQMLVSARWIMTFTYFERQLYENPDQDLNGLWWKLVEEIQYIHSPEHTNYPDWASKMHFSLAPVSYQNYLLGELTASQLQSYIETHVSKDLFTNEVGSYLIKEFIEPGASLHWNDKIKKATGESLNPSYFVKQFLSN